MTANLFRDDVHPRLFLSSSDLPLLREHASRGFGKLVADEILRRAQACIDPDSPRFVDPTHTGDQLLEGMGGGRFNKTADALHCLTFAYLLTDDGAHRDRAEAILRALVERPSANRNICLRLLGNQVTLAYDLLHDTLPPALRDALKAYISDAADIYHKAVLDTPTSHGWNVGINTFHRDFEKLVIARAATMQGTALHDELTQASRRVRQSIHMGLDEGGAILEGPGYGRRDAEWLSFMAEVLVRAGVCTLWEDEPKFAEMVRNWAYLVLPGRRGQLDYCDAPRVHSNRPHVGALLHAKRLDDALCRWIWDTLSGEGATVGTAQSPDAFQCHLGLILLWHDEDAPRATPEEAGLAPSRKSGAVGLHTMRTGWDDDDVALTLLSSEHDPACYIHQHVDAGHFDLFALNELFSIDSGYGDILGRYHSVMMPGGVEPSRAPDGFNQMWYGGHNDAFAAGRHVDYARVSTGEQWEVPYAYRHAMLVKAPGAPAYVLLLDNVNAGPTFGLYRWQMNSEPGNRIDVSPADERAVVHGQAHRLEVAWSYPGADEYPQAHRLELSTDKIGSMRKAEWIEEGGHRTGSSDRTTHPDGGYVGLGPRPRLLADLHGYNGHLLTALIPRRSGDAAVPVERVLAHDQLGIRIDWGDVVDTVLVSPITRHLDADGLAGEATIAVVRRSAQDGRAVWWAVADGYALVADGADLLAQSGTASVLAEMP